MRKLYDLTDSLESRQSLPDSSTDIQASYNIFYALTTRRLTRKSPLKDSRVFNCGKSCFARIVLLWFVALLQGVIDSR